jgi:hypothetical protein
VSGERRWVVIVENGGHSTLGRHTDPSEDEIRAAEVAMVAQGVAGWLAVTEGVYYSRDPLSVMQVRVLGAPTADWESSVAKFLQLRATNVS